jgi:hypothetical protein
MVTKLVQNTCSQKRRKTIHNYLKNVPSKKKGHPTTNFDNIFPIVIKDNNILELQSLLEHNDFTNKLATIIKQMLYMYQTNIIE